MESAEKHMGHAQRGYTQAPKFGAGADAGKYQGHSYTDVYIDEGGNFPNPHPIDKLNTTLRNPHGIPYSFNVSANPGGPGHEWIKKRYIDPAPLGMEPVIDDSSNAKRIYIQSRLEDNRLLMDGDPGYIARLKKSGPPWLVQAWLMGDWNATPEGVPDQSAVVQTLQRPALGIFTSYSGLGYRL